MDDLAQEKADQCRCTAKQLIASSRKHRARGDDLAARSTLEESIREMVRCEVWSKVVESEDK